MSIETAISLILRVIDMVVEGIGITTKSKAKYLAVRNSIQRFVDEKRDPTPTEWYELDAKIAENSDRIQKS